MGCHVDFEFWERSISDTLILPGLLSSRQDQSALRGTFKKYKISFIHISLIEFTCMILNSCPPPTSSLRKEDASERLPKEKSDISYGKTQIRPGGT